MTASQAKRAQQYRCGGVGGILIPRTEAYQHQAARRSDGPFSFGTRVPAAERAMVLP